MLVSYRRLSNDFAKWMEDGFYAYGQGESFTYEALPGLLQVQPGQQPEPVMFMIVMMPGAILGTSFHTHVIVYNPSIATPETVMGDVKRMCDGLRALRTETLRQLEAHPDGDALPIEPNGQPNLIVLPPPGG